MTEADKTKRKPIEATKTCRRLMADHFRELDEAARSGAPKIAWCTSVGPAELLRAMGFLVYFPENHGAMLGSTRMAADLIPAANAIGYSPDICSYLTSDIGSYLRGETPLKTAYGMDLPRPDVLVYNTNQCRDVQDWFAWYAREFQAPLVGIHTQRGVGPVMKSHVEDQAAQIRALIPTLEEVSGRKFDLDRLKETVAESLAVTRLWRAVLECGAARPSPLTFFDACILMGPAVVARGTREATVYYEQLLAELREKIGNREAAVEGERFRLYWEGMPVWGRLRALSDLFLGLKSGVVASTYCNSWIFDALDPDQPFEGMARAYIELFIVRNDDFKEDYIARMHDLYKLDGIIYHDAKTCPNNTNSRYGMPQRLEERLGLPSLTINGDLNDLRCYSEEQSVTNIEAFVEQLADDRV
ncbi:MAG: 2-hydroxyacyl-CoA dehydratase family protein [Proteobacteria bacterium]|nr:2-hydroxyacyl-CoA dehydratase family protein [Pseudomonadota bacterium]